MKGGRILAGQARRPRWTRFLRWLAPIAWAALIYHATASPAYTGEHTGAVVAQALPAASGAAVHIVNILVRKATHFLAYGTLAALVWWAMPGGAAAGGSAAAAPREARLQVSRAACAWGLATLYAASDELHQRFVPGRSAEVADVLLDSAAALMMLSVLTLARHRRGQSPE